MHPRVPARPICYSRTSPVGEIGFFPDISFRDEGFETSTAFTLRLLQRSGAAFLPAGHVPHGPARPGQYVTTFVAAFGRSQRLQRGFAAARELSYDSRTSRSR